MILGSHGRRVSGIGIATLAASGALALPTPASAATVTVRPDPDTAWEGSTEPAYDEVHYVAAPGEPNRLLIAYADDARSVVVTDPGAQIAASGSCLALDAHTARCVARPGARVEWLQSTRAELGDLDDELRTTRPGPAPIGGVVADGGPGDDLLDGGAGSDRLDGAAAVIIFSVAMASTSSPTATATAPTATARPRPTCSTAAPTQTSSAMRSARGA